MSVSSLSSKLVEMAARMNQAPNNGVANKNDIVCTPDLFNFLNESLQQTSQRAQPTPSTSAAAAAGGPPPLLIRNLQTPGQQRGGPPARGGPPPNPRQTQVAQKRSGPPLSRQPNTPLNQVVTSPANNSSPIYHTINGFRIDLNTAAQQTTYQLPNGKIIQVKKQAPVNTNVPTTSQLARQIGPNTSIRPMNNARARPASRQPAQRPILPQQRFGPPPNQRPPPAHAQVVSYPQHPQPGMGQRVPGAHQFLVQQMPSQHPGQPQQMPGAQGQPGQRQLANGLPALGQMRKYPDTLIGNSQRQLERQIFGGQEICHHIVGKLNTLMNSNAYKTVRSMNDIKELHIHLSYLLTYTIGRFKTLQEKCMEDMRKMGFKSDADSLVSGQVIDKYGSDCEEDDLEVVEPVLATIAIIDSDDDDSDKSKSAPKSIPAGLRPKTEILEQAEEVSTELVSESLAEAVMDDVVLDPDDCPMDISALLEPQVILGDEDDSAKVDENEIPMPPPLTPPPNTDIDLIKDDKLNSPTVVILSRCEKDFPAIKDQLESLNEMDDDKVESISDEEPAVEIIATANGTSEGESNEKETSEIEISEAETLEKPEDTEKENPDSSDILLIEDDEKMDSSSSEKPADENSVILLDDSANETPVQEDQQLSVEEKYDQSEPMEMDRNEVSAPTILLEENVGKENDTTVLDNTESKDEIAPSDVTDSPKEDQPQHNPEAMEIPEEATPTDQVQDVDNVTDESKIEGESQGKQSPVFSSTENETISEIPEYVLIEKVAVDDETVNNITPSADPVQEEPATIDTIDTITDPGSLEPSLLEPSIIEPFALLEEDLLIPQIGASSAGNTNGTTHPTEDPQSDELENISSPDTFEDYSKNGIDANKVLADDKTLPASDAFAETIDDLLSNSEQFSGLDDINQLN